MSDSTCSMKDACRNCGERCPDCIAYFQEDENVLDVELPLLYVPVQGAPKQHPITLKRKDAKRRKQFAAGEVRRSEAVQKRKRQTNNALKVEGQTRGVLARATLRSGALLGDGDSRLVGKDGEELSVGIDDKFHSKAFKTVSLSTDEIDKAQRQGCFIVVTLANGRKFAVAEFNYFTAAAKEIAAHTT